MVTMGAEPIFIDTNILIYANNRESDFCESARDRLYELADNVTSLVISDQVLREYLVVMTRPGFIEKPISNKSALEDIQRMIQEYTLVFPDMNSVDMLVGLIRKYKIKGKRVHDAAIVSVMLANGIKDLLTYNTNDFIAFREITVHSL